MLEGVQDLMMIEDAAYPEKGRGNPRTSRERREGYDDDEGRQTG